MSKGGVKITGYKVREDLKLFVSDLKKHQAYMRRVSDSPNFSLGTAKRKDSKIGAEILFNIENSFENFKKDSQTYIPPSIRKRYYAATINAMRFIHDSPITSKHQKQKNKIAERFEGTDYKGFNFRKDPSFFMTGRFTFFVLESMADMTKSTFKFVKPKGVLNIGVITRDDPSNVSPYLYMRSKKKKTRPGYFKDIGYRLKANGLLSSASDLESDDGEVQERDKYFFGLLPADAMSIAEASTKYLVRYYAKSFQANVTIDPRSVSG